MRLLKNGKIDLIYRYGRRSSFVVRKYSAESAPGRPRKGDRPSVYDSGYVERDWYKWWEECGHFKTPAQWESQKKRFVLCLPPPNVTGDLHIGHALTVAVEDVLTRWHRMMGDQTVWVPGFDHAGIATQVVVEKQLMREKGLRRVDMNREDFVAECLRWKEKKIQNIQMQLKRLGASLDWSRCYYTMDENFSNAVTEAFLRLHQRGLIFRAEKLVNWCPTLKSTISDVEVEKVTIDGENSNGVEVHSRGKPVPLGRLYLIKYPLLDRDHCPDRDRFITVATSRPETIPADVALAVHPDDHRYAAYIGQYVQNPILDGAPPIIIVADRQVDPKFGTGAMKVTPAHDWTDFEIGRRHGLPLNRSCMTEDAKLNEICGPDLADLDRFEARRRIVEMLSSKKLLDGFQRQQQITLPTCSRTGDIIEPMIKQQWFLNCRSLADELMKALEGGNLKVKPQFFETQMKYWLSLTGDWCLSRQLWWGHRIPAYQVRGTENWYCGRTAPDALESAKRSSPDMEISLSDLIQDEDVLDTWFSSSLVPLVVSGWPDQSPDHNYPLSLMETGHDIMTFWVSRMMMMGTELVNRAPFDQVLFHGIVFDKQGRKMSKSLGNVIDPLDIIDGVQLETLQQRIEDSILPREEIKTAKEAMAKEFPEGVLPCGADALRFTLLKQDIICEKLNLDVNLMHSGRKFCNKLWQAVNFMESAWKLCAGGGWRCDGHLERIKENFPNLSVMDRWILSRLSRTVDLVNTSLENREFHLATTRLYEFAWFELCDAYLESTKFYLRPVESDGKGFNNQQHNVADVLYLVADVYTRCLAPFMPFLAEELFGRLLDVEQQQGSGRVVTRAVESIHTCEFPLINELPFENDEIEEGMAIAKKIWDATRSFRQEAGFTLREQLTCVLFGDSASMEATTRFANFISSVAKVDMEDCRPLDESKSFPSGYLWKSVDETMLIAVKVKDADRARVAERLAAQIDKLKKRRLKNERRERALVPRKLKRSADATPAVDQYAISLSKKENIDAELSRLEQMYENVTK